MDMFPDLKSTMWHQEGTVMIMRLICYIWLVQLVLLQLPQVFQPYLLSSLEQFLI